MTDIEALARSIRQMEEQLVVCMRCGMCQAVCPLYRETRREADVARGKLALLDGLADGLLHRPEGVARRLQRCLLCGSCAAHCPSGVRALDVFFRARAILTEVMGLSPAQRLFLRGLLRNPTLLDVVAAWGARFQGRVMDGASEPLSSLSDLLLSKFLGNRHPPKLALEPFHERTPEIDLAPGTSGLKVGFFVGCLIDKFFPGVAEATIEVLRHHGVGIHMPNGQGCCGIPAAAKGDIPTFSRLIRRHMDLFPPDRYDVLVTACATCTYTIGRLWPLLHRGEGKELERVRLISAKTVDIHEFLIKRLGIAARPTAENWQAVPVTYHDPCHLKKSLDVHEEPRRLIRAVPGLRLIEMEEPDSCCGFGGSFGIEHPKVSRTIGNRKSRRVVDSGCRMVLTSCPACMMQLMERLDRVGAPIKVAHVMEAYASACGEHGQERLGSAR